MASDETDNRYFNLLQDMLNRIENRIEHTNEKLDTNTLLTREVKAQAEKTNGRVTKLEKAVFGRVTTPKDLPPLWRDPKVISIVFNISLAILVLVIAATKVDVGKLLP